MICQSFLCPTRSNISFVLKYLQLIVLRGSMHEDHFRHSNDSIIQRVWEERIEPYIDDPIYTVIKQ